MLDSTTLGTYLQLKKRMDAAYTVFKKEPSVINATRHTAAAQAFTTFCVDTMAVLAGDTEDSNKKEQILANIEQYRTCEKCESELLYPVDNRGFIESNDFVPDFPGWCHTCLVEHCCAHDCATCTLPEDADTCSYKEIKKLYLED